MSRPLWGSLPSSDAFGQASAADGCASAGSADLPIIRCGRIVRGFANRYPQAIGHREFGLPPSSDGELRMRALSHGILILPEEIGTAEPPIRTAERSPSFNMTRA